MKQGVSENQQKILRAIESGHTTYAAIAKAAGISSTSVVSRNLRQLADAGHIVLNARTGRVAAGRDFCTGWDAACRLAGNPDA